MSSTAMLTAAEAAMLLKISARKVYALAAAGELASHRFGTAVRFTTDDLEAYKTKCRSPATTRDNGSSSFAVQLPGIESALTSYFRKAGREPKPKNSTRQRPPGKSPLHLVSSPSSA